MEAGASSFPGAAASLAPAATKVTEAISSAGPPSSVREGVFPKVSGLLQAPSTVVQAAHEASSDPGHGFPTTQLLPAEDLASAALQSRDFSENTCVGILCRAFQHPVSNRRGGTLGHAPTTDYFRVGLFHNRSVWGLTSYCQTMPHVVRYLNAFLSALAPAGRWWALAVSANVATACKFRVVGV